MKCRAQTHLPRGLRFPVPLDKGNEGSGDEIENRAVVVACEEGSFRRRIRKALEIRCQSPTITQDRGFELPALWADALARGSVQPNSHAN